MNRTHAFLAAALAAAGLGGCATSPGGSLDRIEHIVVIYAENRSFDHLYGMFPGANGVAAATAAQKTQLDHNGKPLPYLPPVFEDGRASARFTARLPNEIGRASCRERV